MSEVEEKVRSVLEKLPTLFLSTANSDEPWGAGAFFTEADPFTLHLVLEAHGKTLGNIKANPRVAVVVSSGSPFEAFLQGAADVELIDDDAEVEAVKQALVAKAPAIEPFFEYAHQAVRLKVRSWRATDVGNGWIPGKEIQAPTA